MKVRISSSGRSAKSDTINDLNQAMDEMNKAIAELSRCKGLGAEIYNAKIEDMISKYRTIKSIISKIG